MANQNIEKIFDSLLSAYGYQGWWPLYHTSSNSTAAFFDGYHPKRYDFPHTDLQKLEICLGAILTQNTHWRNVVKSLSSLAENRLISVLNLVQSRLDQIALAIKSVGYYNQKAKYLKNIAVYLSQNSFAELEQLSTPDARNQLLDIPGIGPETADCILLYALKKPSFVVDTYTKRIFTALGIIQQNAGYQHIKSECESSLPDDLPLFQEFHALLVRHGKTYYSQKPWGKGDFLLS